MDALSEFRRSVAGRRFALGSWDCGLLCAEWVRMVRGVDPAAEWRGRYRTLLGLSRLLKRRGGMVAHFDACLLPLGIQRTVMTQRGDVAIVDTAEGLTGGVLTGPMVLLAGGRGYFERSLSMAPVVAAWRV